jgi:hypothetical protein
MSPTTKNHSIFFPFLSLDEHQVSVVNIDNGFGAAMVALKILDVSKGPIEK